jgi:hypothetical protein
LSSLVNVPDSQALHVRLTVVDGVLLTLDPAAHVDQGVHVCWLLAVV